MKQSFSARIHTALTNVAGFTMIELLVVISIIGILAVAVLSALNPIEQINKGRDTGLRSDAEQLLSSAERYFSIHQDYPWNEVRPNTGPFPYQPAVPGDFTQPFNFVGPNDFQNANSTWNWMYQLSDTQEVKPAFVARLISQSKLIVVRLAGPNASTEVCFSPSSYAFQLEAAKACEPNGGAVNPAITNLPGGQPNACKTTDGTIPTAPAANYICLP